MAFRFVRFNIPFYALPKVNFFIIHEMGIINHKELLNSFEKLKNSPSYSIRGNNTIENIIFYITY